METPIQSSMSGRSRTGKEGLSRSSMAIQSGRQISNQELSYRQAIGSTNQVELFSRLTIASIAMGSAPKQISFANTTRRNFKMTPVSYRGLIGLAMLLIFFTLFNVRFGCLGIVGEERNSVSSRT